MQHPDEGTIHAWLDGALNAEEARAFEAHVAECATCAAAVTEARGLLAASSRILSALDSVPGGVLPAAEPAIEQDERVIPTGRSSLWRSPGWRAAAAIVLVGSVSWLATRSVGRQAEERAASPTEAAGVAVYAPPEASARTRADSVAHVGAQSAPPRAPSIAPPTARRESTGNGSTASAGKTVVPPAPAPQVVAAPQVMSYAMPKLAESPNAGTAGGAASRDAFGARSTAPTAQAAQSAAPARDSIRSMREETRVADAEVSLRGAAKAAPRMKASAAGAASGALAPMEAARPLDASVARLVGCYYIETAASNSNLPAIRSAAGLVPAQLELLPDLDPSAGGSWRILRPAPGAPPFRLAARASWLVLGADSVRLELGEGTQSVTARMRVKGDSIRGHATVSDPMLPAGGMGTGMRGSRVLCSTP